MQKEKYIINENFSKTVNCYPMARKSFRKAKENTAKKVTRVTLMYIIPCVLIAWVVLSWANTITHNLTDFTYAKWNMFNIFDLLR